MKKAIGIALALSSVLFLMPTPALAHQNTCPVNNQDKVLCFVDIGDPASEAGHHLVGWGPIEPETHGGNWGGFNSTGENLRVIWSSDDNPKATIDLECCSRLGMATSIELRHLDGIADDSFDIYVKNGCNKWVKIGSYEDDDPAGDEETWRETSFNLPANKTFLNWFDRTLEVKLVATGTKWDLFDTYGQVAFDWIQVVGNARWGGSFFGQLSNWFHWNGSNGGNCGNGDHF